jgi:DNA-binding MarR family transcriptional regulator
MLVRSKSVQVADTLSDEHIGLEARAQDADHLDVKMWLRLLACSAQIERQVSQLLRIHFDTSLPRFDYLAQLERHPEGLRMNVLSRYLMVTGGNVTKLTDQLAEEGWVERVEDPEDRRSWRVRLTGTGRAEFLMIARHHERWLTQLFQGLPRESKEALYQHLGRLRLQLASYATEIEGSSGGGKSKWTPDRQDDAAARTVRSRRGKA